MKKIKVLLALTAITLVGANLLGNGDWYKAQVLSEQKPSMPESRLLGISSTFVTPENPDFLNTFNVYRQVKSEAGVLARYTHQIKESTPEFTAKFANEIVSFIDRVSKNPALRDKLPMYPEHNVATVGNVMAYLFAHEANPLEFAKANGIVAADAKSGSFLSRAQFIDIVAKIFIDSERDALEVLEELGFIDSARTWEDESRAGFKMVEAIRLVLQIRELIERKNINAAKAEYASNLTYLGPGAAVLNESSLKVLTNAFAAEGNVSGTLHERGLDTLKKQFEGRMEEKLTADLITEARESFFKAVRKKVPAAYELPPALDLGTCTNEAFRKAYMGPVAVTGPLGAIIACDYIAVILPANSYLINVFSLPKVSLNSNPENPEELVVRTDVLRSYENALVVNSNGEQKVSLLYRPENTEEMVGTNFNIIITDHAGNERGKLSKPYTENGVVMKIHLRTLDGDNFIFQK